MKNKYKIIIIILLLLIILYIILDGKNFKSYTELVFIKILNFIQENYNKNKLIGIIIICIFQNLNCILSLPFYLIFNVLVVFIMKDLTFSIFIINITTLISSFICQLIANIWKDKILLKIMKYDIFINLKNEINENPWKISWIIRNSIILSGIKNYGLTIFLNNDFIYYTTDLISNIIPTIQIIMFSKGLKNIDNIFNNEDKFNYFNWIVLLISLFMNIYLIKIIKNITMNKNQTKTKNHELYFTLEE